ncbi:MAG: SurA N-terminal domain-containing protein [Solitalea-like symbiont of Tyrophagus putrescentiae]
MILRFLREKAAWLLSGFLLLALLSFILGDFLVGRKGVSQHSETDDAIVGQIDNRIISYTEFNDLVTRTINNQKATNPNPVGDTTLNEAILYTDVVQTIWKKLLNETLISKATSDMGISVDKDELFDMVEGNHIDPEVKQFFGVDPNSTIDVNIIRNFINQLSLPASANLRQTWKQFEYYLVNKRLTNKYINLLSNSVFVNSLEAKSRNDFYNTKADLDYIMIDYDYLKDSINVSNKELQDYYNVHKNRFKNDEEIRNVNYAVLNILPSQEDSLKIKNALTELVPKFQHTNQDSLFASINSDYNQHLVLYSKKDAIGANVANNLFNAKKNSVYGPYLDGNTYKLAKLIYTDALYSEVKIKHILFSANEPLEKVNGILNDIKNKKQNFQDAAKAFSIDSSSKTNGGEIGWLNLDMPIPESIKDNCFKKHSPDLQVVKSNLGIHIIEIIGRRDLSQKAKIAYVTKAINASQATRDAHFTKIKNALSELNTTKDMKTVAHKYGLQYFNNEKIKPWGPYNNLNDPNSHIETYKYRKLIQWIFKAKKGDLSPAVEENDSYAIAEVIGIDKKGFEPFNEVQKDIKSIVTKEKKYNSLVKYINTYLQNNNVSLADVSKHFNAPIKKGYSLSMLSDNYELYGAIIGSKTQKLSKAVKGNNGVYIFYTNNKQTNNQDDISSNLLHTQQVNFNLEVLIKDMLKVLETNRKIKDNRVMLL